MAAVYVKVNLLHFLSQYQEKKMAKKVYQEVSKVYFLVDILVLGNSTLPINDFLHPGGLAGYQVLQVAELCALHHNFKSASFTARGWCNCGPPALSSLLRGTLALHSSNASLLSCS